MLPRKQVTTLKAVIPALAVVGQPMVKDKDGTTFGGAGIEAGGRIVLGSATTADVTVYDQTGRTLYKKTGVVATVDIDPIPTGVKAPLLVDVANNNGTLTIYWWVRK